MPSTEKELKEHLKSGEVKQVYMLYGEESYLTTHYVEQLVGKSGVRENDELSVFNYQRFDGQESSFDAIEAAAESLPLMADVKCVTVSNCDVTAAAIFDRAMALVNDPPEGTVLIFWMTTLLSDGKLNAKWKQFAEAVERNGMCIAFPRKSNEEIARILCTGAGRRGCLMKPQTALLLVEQCGNDMNLLLNELDKLCALAANGEITASILEQVATKNLNAQAYELSGANLKNQYDKAYIILHRLFASKTEPVMILAALSNAYTDMYRAKLAAIDGRQAETLVEEFDYKGKAFRLRYAARDCSRLSLEALRESLELLAQADRRLKSSSSDKKTVLEELAAKLIITAKLGQTP